MAHFAEIDIDNNVLRVVVISNADIVDHQGKEVEQIGIDLCNIHVGTGEWVQTSYNGKFRKIFGQPGCKYAPDADVFYDPMGPFPSWTLDANYDWQPPTPMPEDGKEHWWDETTLSWVQIESPEK